MNNKRTGLVCLVTALLAISGTVTLTQEEVDSAYYCPFTEQIAIFSRLSSSMKTGYYMENGEERSIPCKEGRVYESWVSLSQYAEDNNIPIEDLLQPTIDLPESDYAIVSGNGGDFYCEYQDRALRKYSKCYQNGVFLNYAGELICGG